MTPFVVVMSDHKRPKYFVARRMIGDASYAVICTTNTDFMARTIATSLSATEEARMQDERNIVPIKPSRKRA